MHKGKKSLKKQMAKAKRKNSGTDSLIKSESFWKRSFNSLLNGLASGAGRALFYEIFMIHQSGYYHFLSLWVVNTKKLQKKPHMWLF